MDAPKRMTNALLAEHGLKQAKVVSALLKKCLQVIGDESEPDLENAIKNALQEADTVIEWYESGKGLEAFQKSDPDDEGEDYDTYAPEVYTLNSLDLSSFDSPELEAGYQDALKRRRAIMPPAAAKLSDILNGVQGVM